MPIVLVRVDDRLIHGQILESWLPSTRAQELLVANDALADDQLQKMIMESAIPFSVSLRIDRVERIASMLKSSEGSEVRQIVLVENPMDALRLIRAGVEFDLLNLGNLRSQQSNIALSASVWVGEDGLDALLNIIDAGVDVQLQSVPFEKPVHLCDVVDCRTEALYPASQIRGRIRSPALPPPEFFSKVIHVNNRFANAWSASLKSMILA